MDAEQDISGFIRSTFRSVWALELLCYLRKHEGRALSHDEMVAGLRGSDLVVRQSVEALAAAGLVLEEEGGGARYAPANADLDRLAVAAETAYATSPNAIRRMIVGAANAGLTAFADAFKLRKD